MLYTHPQHTHNVVLYSLGGAKRRSHKPTHTHTHRTGFITSTANAGGNKGYTGTTSAGSGAIYRVLLLLDLTGLMTEYHIHLTACIGFYL